MKFTCFIDASSYINLTHDDSYLNGKTLLDLLSEITTIKFCSEVNFEISRRSNSLTPNVEKRKSNVYFLKYKKIKTYKEYESRLYDSISKKGDKNIGERQNLAVTIDCYLNKKIKGLIFLTDDKKAVNGILDEALTSFPILNIWNSFDVILFLYLENRHFTIDIAKGAVRSLNAEIAKGSSSNTDHKKTQKRIKIFRDYYVRLDRVKRLIA